MPTVGKKSFPYTPKGVAAAKKMADKTDMPMHKEMSKDMPAHGKEAKKKTCR